MFGQASTSEMVLPQFEASEPVSVYVNGKVVPPIEAEGKITSFNLSGLQLRCTEKIPIPAAGIISFRLGHQKEELKLKVVFVSRVDLSKTNWLFRNQPDYEFNASFADNPRELVEKFQHHFHKLLYGGNMVGKAKLSYSPVESEF